MCYSSLEVEAVSVGGSSWVIVQFKYVQLPGAATSAGPIKPVRVIFNGEGEYSVEVLMKVLQTGSWKKSHPPYKEICSVLDTFLRNVLCPCAKDYICEFSRFICFHFKNLWVWWQPIRHDSVVALFGIKQLTYTSLKRIHSLTFVLAAKCCTLVIKNWALETSPDHTAKWRDPSSNRPFKYVQWVKCSVLWREMRSGGNCLKLSKSMNILWTSNSCSGQQDEETQKLVMVIEAKGKNQLAGIISETQQTGNEVGYDVLQAWQRNVTSCKDFFNDQLWSCKCNS